MAAAQPQRGNQPGRPVIMVCANQAWNLVNFRAGLIRALVASGARVIAVAPPDPVCEAQLAAMGCSFEPLYLDAAGLAPFRDLRSFWAIRRLLLRYRPDVWLSWTIKPNLYGSLAAGLLGIAALPNISGLGTAFIRNTPLTWLVRLLYRLCLRRCPMVFFQNADDRDLFAQMRLVSADQPRLLPGSGIDPDHFRPANMHRPGPRRFVMIARLLADKGVREYVAAAAALRREFPDAQFHLIGFLNVANRTAISFAEVDQWVADGSITYQPPLDDVRPAIAAADWVVLPSYREGMSRVLLEAAAMARPIVTSDAPGCRDIVTDGENGFLAAPRNAPALTAAMRRAALLDDAGWHRMAQAGRQRVVEQFSQASVTACYCAALRDVGLAGLGAP